MIWAAIKMILALGGILAFLFLLVKGFKRMEGRRRNGGSGAGIRVLTSKLIAPQKYVSLVEIGGEVLALGVTNQQITFLAKIEDKELVKQSLSPHPLRPEAPSWLRNGSLLQKRVKEEALEARNEK